MKKASEIRRLERERLGQVVQAWRIHNGWTQMQLGETIKMHQSNLSDIENGTVRASDDSIDRLAKAFGIPPMDLVRSVGPPDMKKAVKVKG